LTAKTCIFGRFLDVLSTKMSVYRHFFGNYRHFLTPKKQFYAIWVIFLPENLASEKKHFTFALNNPP